MQNKILTVIESEDLLKAIEGTHHKFTDSKLVYIAYTFSSTYGQRL